MPRRPRQRSSHPRRGDLVPPCAGRPPRSRRGRRGGAMRRTRDECAGAYRCSLGNSACVSPWRRASRGVLTRDRVAARGPDDRSARSLTSDHMVTYSLVVDEVFKALADPTRRALLALLFEEHGRTLSALERRLPMSRFGVMKHLKVLEEANLVVTRRRGREKLHFLNPVPIRLIHDRWVSKYAEPWAAGLSELKDQLEDRTMEKVFEIYIKTTPDRLWQAITDPDMRAKYNFGMRVASDWTPGSTYKATAGQNMPLVEGENLEIDPPRRLVQTMRALWGEDVKSEGTSRV